MANMMRAASVLAVSSSFDMIRSGPYFSEPVDAGLRQLTEHICMVMETELPKLRIGGTDYPTEIVKDAFDRLKKEDVKAILGDFHADPLAFGSMRVRLFEAGQQNGSGSGFVPASNVSWGHDTTCQGKAPLEPLDLEDEA